MYIYPAKARQKYIVTTQYRLTLHDRTSIYLGGNRSPTCCVQRRLLLWPKLLDPCQL